MLANIVIPHRQPIKKNCTKLNKGLQTQGAFLLSIKSPAQKIISMRGQPQIIKYGYPEFIQVTNRLQRAGMKYEQEKYNKAMQNNGKNAAANALLYSGLLLMRDTIIVKIVANAQNIYYLQISGRKIVSRISAVNIKTNPIAQVTILTIRLFLDYIIRFNIQKPIGNFHISQLNRSANATA